MKTLTSSNSSSFIKTLVPGFAGVTILTTGRTIQNAFSHTQRMELGIGNPQSSVLDHGSKWLFKPLSRVAEEGLEDNYLAFLMLILIVNAFLHGADIIRGLFIKKGTQSKASSISQWNTALTDQDWPLLDRMKQILGSLLVGSLIFCLYQVLWVGLGSILSLQALNETTLNSIQSTPMETVMPSRILEETSSSLQLQEYKKPSLSIGKVLGQVDLHALSIQVSKDGRTAFIITPLPSTLKIIDVSEPESPIILSSLIMPSSEIELKYFSDALIVSPDETKLYLRSFEYLLVVDIHNLKSPKVLATIEDNDILTLAKENTLTGYAKPHLLLSKDLKFLFVSEFGLRIFDVSVPTAPTLLRSLSSRVYPQTRIPSSIALSADKKTLYYSDGSLWIYDVEDPKNLQLLSSFNTTNPITSMIVSDDVKTAFVLGQDEARGMKIYLQTLDISDIYSIKEGQVTRFNQVSDCSPVFLERTPGNLFLMILFTDLVHEHLRGLLIFDTREQQLIEHEKLFIKDALSVVFTQDYRRVFIGNYNKFQIADLYLNFPNKHSFTTSSNTVRTFNVTYSFFSMNNEKTIYSVTNDGFRIDQIGSSNKLKKISFYNAKEIINSVISKDSKRAFLIYEDRVEILDISKPENISILGEYTVKARVEEPEIHTLVPSLDGKTLYLTFSGSYKAYLDVVDLSDPTNATQMSSTEFEQIERFARSLLSNDGRTLFIISQSLEIYDVIDPASPKLLSKFSFAHKESIFATLSADGKALFVRDESGGRIAVVSVIDVSNTAAPQKRSEFRFNRTGGYFLQSETKAILASGDSKTIYITRKSSLMVVDVSNLSDPKYLGSIKMGDDKFDSLQDFCLSDDGRKAFILTREGKLVTTSIEPKYSTFILQDNLMLGERYNINLQVLKMNEYLDYDQMEVDYRFTKFSLVEPNSIRSGEIEEVVLKTPPSWMSFDLKSQTLSVEARRKSDIKLYKAYFGFSTRIPKNVFSKLKIGNETVKYQDIFSLLIALDYVDNQLFLTENFEGYDDFILPSLYDPVKKEIYQIMRGSSFGTYNELRIVESLNVSSDTDNNKLKISTTSGTNLKVEISLTGEAQFLHRYYGLLMPTITNNKSRLVMEGSLKDINLALREVVVNLGNGKSCDGEIIVDDKLNPIVTEPMQNISRYFSHNTPPALNNKSNLTIQNQVDKELVYTGQHFQIKLNPYTFFDHHTEVENLNYQLVFMEDNNETTILPSWLSFSDMTLMGTAPEEIFDRNFEFKLIVKNEFQELKVPLKLHVSISSGFVLKLVMKYSPYILTALGLYMKANMIYNILAKKKYKHIKNFYLNIGEEISSEVIFPISFIHEEVQQAEEIMRVLEKELGKKNQLLSNFMSEERKRLDKFKVIETIKEVLMKLSPEEKKSFDLYLGGAHPEKIIIQIIINTLAGYMLDEDKETRVCYEKLKQDWPKLVNWDLTNSCFKINDEMMNTFLNRSSNETTDDRESLLLSSSFIEKSNININLLKDSILAYAFECQNIDVLPESIQIHVKKKIKASFWKEFLKLDLKDRPLREKTKIGYGIECFQEYQTVFFNGVARPDIRNVVLVVQITNLRHRILKELWIFGGKSESEPEEAGVEKKEIDAKGKEYEVF